MRIIRLFKCHPDEEFEAIASDFFYMEYNVDAEHLENTWYSIKPVITVRERNYVMPVYIVKNAHLKFEDNINLTADVLYDRLYEILALQTEAGWKRSHDRNIRLRFWSNRGIKITGEKTNKALCDIEILALDDKTWLDFDMSICNMEPTDVPDVYNVACCRKAKNKPIECAIRPVIDITNAEPLEYNIKSSIMKNE